MENSWWSNLVGTIGWIITFAVWAGLLLILLWLAGVIFGFSLAK
jgi:hypothetical protein